MPLWKFLITSKHNPFTLLSWISVSMRRLKVTPCRAPLSRSLWESLFKSTICIFWSPSGVLWSSRLNPKVWVFYPTNGMLFWYEKSIELLLLTCSTVFLSLAICANCIDSPNPLGLIKRSKARISGFSPFIKLPFNTTYGIPLQCPDSNSNYNRSILGQSKKLFIQISLLSGPKPIQ